MTEHTIQETDHFGDPSREDRIHTKRVKSEGESGGTMADYAYHTPAPMANERWLSSRRCEQNL